MDLHPVIYVLIGFFGLFVGSFFNVAIHRWPQEDPKEREWVKTRSHCPKCGALIRWFDNIPLLSYAMLGGRCRSCRQPISWRYPAVELGTALLWVLTAWLVANHGLTGLGPAAMTGWHIAFAILFASLCLLTVVIDFETSLIPMEITIAFLAGAWLFLWVCRPATISGGFLDSLYGMLVLAAFFFILAWFNGMGMGDVELALGMGALFGWKLVLTAGFLGMLLGGLVAIVIILMLVAKRRYKRGIPIPFGPYLALATFTCMFYGREILDAYLSLFRP